MPPRICAVCCVLLSVASVCAGAAVIAHTSFDPLDQSDGWVALGAAGDAVRSESRSLVARDEGPELWFFAAPPAFGRDVRRAYLGRLVYETGSSHSDAQNRPPLAAADVMISCKAAGIVLVANGLVAEWSSHTNVDLKLSEQTLQLSTGGMPSGADVRRCLMAVDALLIRGSFYYGMETTWIRNVTLYEGDFAWNLAKGYHESVKRELDSVAVDGSAGVNLTVACPDPDKHLRLELHEASRLLEEFRKSALACAKRSVELEADLAATELRRSEAASTLAEAEAIAKSYREQFKALEQTYLYRIREMEGRGCVDEKALQGANLRVADLEGRCASLEANATLAERQAGATKRRLRECRSHLRAAGQRGAALAADAEAWKAVHYKLVTDERGRTEAAVQRVAALEAALRQSESVRVRGACLPDSAGRLWWVTVTR